jgi:glycosyltransferase involved in cell wall biosynthesis
VRVSILIPTRNRLEYLAQSLHSARQQTHDDLEILVSDDGSTDGSPEYLQRIADDDPRVRIALPNPMPGAFQNIRHLVNAATGDAVTVLGDDDLLEPEYVARLATGLRDPDVNVAFCKHDVIDSVGHPVRGKATRIERDYRYRETAPGKVINPLRPALLGQMWLGSCMFRTSQLRLMGFDSACGSAADWDLALRITSMGPSFFIPDVLWHYRDHAASLSRSQDIARRRDAVAVLQKHAFPDRALEELRIATLRRRLAGLAWALAAADPVAVSPILADYLRMGGSRLSATYLGPALLRRLPRHLAGRLRRTLNYLRGT